MSAGLGDLVLMFGRFPRGTCCISYCFCTEYIQSRMVLNSGLKLDENREGKSGSKRSLLVTLHVPRKAVTASVPSERGGRTGASRSPPPSACKSAEIQ